MASKEQFRITRRLVAGLLLVMTLASCTVYKTISIKSDPPGARVSRGGAVVGETPLELEVEAGDPLACTPSYWSFELEVAPPIPGQHSQRRLINPCVISDVATVYFDFRGPEPVSITSQGGISSTKANVVSSDVDIIPKALTSRQHAHAIVIGVEEYQQKLPKADFAAHDAEIMGQYLVKALSYPEENVVVLLNDRATKTGIEKFIEGWLPDRVENGDSVFIYFSGHGAPNSKTGKAYLVPYDGDPAFVEQTSYPLERLYDRLASLPAKEVVVMLDSCFSGAGGRSVIAKGMRPMALSIENPVLTKGQIVVLTAGSADQVSSTYEQKGHGLLTYFFLKGLQGEADQNQDRSIELKELFEYLKPQVERIARREFHNEQSPQLLGAPEVLRKGVHLVERTNP